MTEMNSCVNSIHKATFKRHYDLKNQIANVLASSIPTFTEDVENRIVFILQIKE